MVYLDMENYGYALDGNYNIQGPSLGPLGFFKNRVTEKCAVFTTRVQTFSFFVTFYIYTII